MSNIKERATRPYQVITEEEKIEHMIKTYMLGKKYLLKGYFEEISVNVEEFLPKTGMIVSCFSELSENVAFYRVFKKYMDATCYVEENLGNDRYKVRVEAFRIATNERRYPRIEANPDAVSINSIRAARNVIKASLFNVPTSVKVHFSEYERRLKNYADEVHVKVFESHDEKFELVRKTGKVFWIKNTQDINSYIPEDENAFVDYRSVLHVDIADVMNDYRKKKIVSELIVPVIYVGHDGGSVPLGYIQLISKNKEIGLETIMELKALTFEMVDRIRDSNTMMINKRQAVTNVSLGGLQIRISDPELKQFLVHQKGFSFDIVFRMQQPITVSSEIVYTGVDRNHDMIIGVKIMGWSSRKGEMERYFQLVNELAKGKI
ncbi:MAG: DUF1577 domain-containing protein [Leptospiraceae bacterium]|nr:DUF1577 domain-containing protein [Leptospiraceae bacterium]MDW8306985.1 DUF1577 domain-containing protein [Leptospiraceae bacterium]